MPKSDETVQERLRRLRFEKGWTQQQVADSLRAMGGKAERSLTQQAVQWWETKGLPDHGRMQLVAELYGVSVQYLLTGSDLVEPADAVRAASLRPIIARMREDIDRLEELVTQPFKPVQQQERTKLTGPGVLPKSDTDSAHKLTRRRR